MQKTGVVIAPPPPLPFVPLPQGWSGECTFSAPGTYSFVCTAHRTEMTGTVVVHRRQRADADAHADADREPDPDAGAPA